MAENVIYYDIGASYMYKINSNHIMLLKRIMTAFMALIMAICCFAAPNVTKNVTLNQKFIDLQVSGNIEVYYTPGSTTTLKIVAPQDVMPNVRATVEKEALKLEAPNMGNATIKAYLTSPVLSSMIASGNSEIKVEKPMTPANGLTIAMVGDSEIKLAQVYTTRLVANVSDNCELSIGVAGVDKCTVTAAGNAEVEIKDVNSNELNITASGNSDVECKHIGVSTLSVSASGNCEIELEGKAPRVTMTASGNATIDAYSLGANTGTATASGEATIKCHVADLSHKVNGNAHIKNR